jgi:hypothetical protein
MIDSNTIVIGNTSGTFLADPRAVLIDHGFANNTRRRCS